MAPPILLAIFFSLMLFENQQYLDFEYRTQKLRYAGRAGSDAPVHKDLLMVAIDDASIERLGRWPWNRDVHADFLRVLTYLPPSVITYDIFFSEASDAKRGETIEKIISTFTGNFGTKVAKPEDELERILAIHQNVFPNYDTLLGEAGALHPNLITGALTQAKPEDETKEVPTDVFPPWKIEGGGRDEPLTRVTGDVTQVFGNPTALYPIPELQKNGHFAFVDTEPSIIDGIRRKYPVIVRTGGRVYPSLGLKTVMCHWGLTAKEVEVRLGEFVAIYKKDGSEIRIPISEKGEMMINYRATDTFKSIGLSALNGELVVINQIEGILCQKDQWIEDFEKGELDADLRKAMKNALKPEKEQEDLVGINLAVVQIVNFMKKAPGYEDVFNDMLKMEGKIKKVSDFYPKGYVKHEKYVPYENPQGRILIVGQTAAGLTDFGPTPYEGRGALVRVQANVIDNILKGDFLTAPSPYPIAVVCLLVMWVTLILLKDKPLLISIGIPVGVVVGYAFFAYLIFEYKSIMFPMLWPTMSFFGCHIGAFYLHWKKESDQKNRIKGMFGTYLSPELVTKMVNSGDEPSLGGEDVQITAFFSDVQSFSSFSEKLTPQQLVDLMNEYLTAMTDVLMAQGCYVDKYIGDAIVGIFNAPVEVKGHALKACVSALKQHIRLEELRQKWRSEGDKWPSIVHNMQSRMGMNTGQATVGNMGSANRFNYTMMGDTVNLAARCESGAKAYGVYTMVTGETKRAAEAEGDDCVFRYLDKIIVKGRSVPAEMYEVVCLRTELTEEIKQCLTVYENALKLFLDQQWDAAYATFMEASKIEANRKEKNAMAPTTPSLVMAERCEYMKEHPPVVAPGEKWDGVYVMKSK